VSGGSTSRSAVPSAYGGDYRAGYIDGAAADLGYVIDRGPVALNVRAAIGAAGTSAVASARPVRIERGDSPYGRTRNNLFFENGLNSLSSVQVPDDNGLDPGSAAFTIEGWVKVATADLSTLMVMISRGSSAVARFSCMTSATGKFRFLVTQVTDVVDISSTTSIVADTWTKWSVTRVVADSKFYLHLNGVKENEAATVAITNYTSQAVLGRNFQAGSDLAFKGRLAGVRWSSTNRYTVASYTPERTPFVSDGSTSLLLDP
jgi:hypothetical protein